MDFLIRSCLARSFSHSRGKKTTIRKGETEKTATAKHKTSAEDACHGAGRKHNLRQIHEMLNNSESKRIFKLIKALLPYRILFHTYHRVLCVSTHTQRSGFPVEGRKLPPVRRTRKPEELGGFSPEFLHGNSGESSWFFEILPKFPLFLLENSSPDPGSRFSE